MLFAITTNNNGNTMLLFYRCLLFVYLFLSTAVQAGQADKSIPQWQWHGVERVAVFGDVHGAYGDLTGLLKQGGLVDAQLRWSGGSTHLVSLGDLLDRGPESRQVMDLLIRLQQEADEAGGGVHVLIGNHEVMNLTGDLRYVSPEEYRAFSNDEDAVIRKTARARYQQLAKAAGRSFDQMRFDEKFPPGYFAHRAAFSPEGKYGHWLLESPFLVKINDTLFTHGGLSKVVAELGGDEANHQSMLDLRSYLKLWQRLSSSGVIAPETEFWDRYTALEPYLLEAAHEPALTGEQRQALEDFMQLKQSLISGSSGLAWYRGTAMCHPATESLAVDAVFERLGARRVVIGHTPTRTRRVGSRMDERIIAMDTGMLASVYRGRASLLFIEGNSLSVVYLGEEGRFSPLPEQAQIPGQAISDADMETFLATADIVENVRLSTGVTNPRKLTLEKDGVRMHALFKDYDSTPRMLLSGVLPKSAWESDRYQHEVAAYKLDRMMQVYRVPVAVIRSVGTRRGVVQYWIPGTITEQKRAEQEIPITGFCSVRDQYMLRYIFDILLYNVDRNLGNLLYSRDDWMLWFIDHSQAFSIGKGKYKNRPRQYYKANIIISPWMRARLQALTQESLEQALGEYLHKKQIVELLKRRDALLDGA